MGGGVNEMSETIGRRDIPVPRYLPLNKEEGHSCPSVFASGPWERPWKRAERSLAAPASSATGMMGPPGPSLRAPFVAERLHVPEEEELLNCVIDPRGARRPLPEAAKLPLRRRLSSTCHSVQAGMASCYPGFSPLSGWFPSDGCRTISWDFLPPNQSPVIAVARRRDIGQENRVFVDIEHS